MKLFKQFIFSIFLIFTSLTFIISCKWQTLDEITEYPLLKFEKSKMSLTIGNVDYLNLSVSENQNSCTINWDYDPEIINVSCDNYGAIITGLKSGSTTITASCGNNSATCLIKVLDEHYSVTIENPYVYASTDVVNVKPGETYKLSASLFGGTSADINGFSWNIDKSNIASIVTEGNYCWITGSAQGCAKLTIRHNKSSFGYSVLINCSLDGTSGTYITSKNDIVTLNVSDITEPFAIDVDLVNPGQADYLSGFTYQLVDASGNTLTDSPVSITSSDNRCLITPLKKGNCYIKVKHPLAAYDYTILVRVLENPDLSYVMASNTNVLLNDIEEQTVNFNVVGVKDFNFEKLDYSFESNASDFIDYTIGGSNSQNSGLLKLKGIKTGTTKLTVSYPGAEPVKVLIIVRELAATAISATTYITTNQNYVSMHIGDGPVGINITLTDTYINAENDLKWSCLSTAADGSSDPVVSCIKSTGSWVSSSTNSRTASLSYSATGNIILVPEKEGSATITVTHPNAKYPCRIVVTVLPAAQTVNNVHAEIIPNNTSLITYLTTSDIKDTDGNIISPANNSSTLYLSVKELDSSSLVWKSTNNDLTIIPSGDNLSAVVTARKDSSGNGIITVSHPSCNYSISFNVIYGKTREEVNTVKVIYSDDIYQSLYTGNSATLTLNTVNVESSDSISWNCSNNNILQLEQINKTQVKVLALSSGNATVTALSDFGSVTFYFNIISDVIVNPTKDTYLSTDQNVIYLENGETQSVTVTPVNINPEYFSQTVWSLDNTVDYTFIANGNTATIQANSKEATGIITVSHPSSQNTLTLYVQTGNRLTYEEKADFTYISTDYDVLEMVSGGQQKELLCYINHTISNMQETSGFSFSIKDTSIASVSNITGTNVAYITPLKAGKTILTVTHPKADYSKEVILIINKGIDFAVYPYITSNQNIITIPKGSFETATVNLQNCEDYSSSSWSWISENSRTADVVSNSGNTCLISGISPGTTRIKIRHNKCEYEYYLVIIVIDDKYIENNPYIQTNTNIIHVEKNGTAQITGKMIGGSADADNFFSFSCSDPNICFVNSAGNTASIKGMNKGSTYINVKNNKYPDAYTKSVLVIVEDTVVSGCSVKLSQNIIKINPSSKDSVIVNAELIGGNPDDAKDFFWWCDDYNILNIDPLAGSCNITATGVSGTTKVHVKHPKTSQINDIIVLISAYDNFSFGEKTKTITCGQLYYIPLQIPATENKADVRYSSSNNDVCVICGSNEVALISGAKYPGTASVKAELLVDSQVIATSEMLVNVLPFNSEEPQINVTNTLLTENKGVPFTVSASLSGNNISEDEKYKIYWTLNNVQNNNCCTAMLDNNGVASGYQIYVTPNNAGDCILTAHYKNSTKDIHVIVLNDKVVTLSLDTSYLPMSIDDGSMKINAILENSNDYASITWTAAKVGGKNIVTLTSQSKTCLVLPRNPGTTFITAQLPDGTKAQCMVHVEEAAKLEFDFNNVDVMPGYTVKVPYTVTPESSSISWLNTFANQNYSSLGSSITEYYSYDVDSINHVVSITGIIDSTGNLSGTLKPYITSGQTTSFTPELNIYVGYNNLQFKCNASTLYMEGDKATASAKLPSESFTVECFPQDTIISFDTLDNDNFSVKASENIITKDDYKLTYKLVTVLITPKKEFLNESITITGKLKNGMKVGERTVSLTALYKSYDIKVDYIIGSSGRFTSVSNNSINLGDGESITFEYTCQNPQAQIKFKDAVFIPVTPEEQNASQINKFDTSNNNFKISNNSNMISDTNVIDFDGNKLLVPNKECLNITKNSLPAGSNYQSYTLRHLFDYTIAETKDSSVTLDDLKSCKGDSNNKWILVKKDMMLNYNGTNYPAINHYNSGSKFKYTKWTDPNLKLVLGPDETPCKNNPGTYNWSEWSYNMNWSEKQYECNPGQSIRWTAHGDGYAHGCDQGYYKRLAIKIDSSLFPSEKTKNYRNEISRNNTYYLIYSEWFSNTWIIRNITNYGNTYPDIPSTDSNHRYEVENCYDIKYSISEPLTYENYALFYGDFLLDNDPTKVLLDADDNTKNISDINKNDFKFLSKENDWNNKYNDHNDVHRTKPYDEAYQKATYNTPNRGEPYTYKSKESKTLSYYFYSGAQGSGGGWFKKSLNYNDYEETVYRTSSYINLSQKYSDSNYLMSWDDFSSCPLFYQNEVITKTQYYEDPSWDWYSHDIITNNFTVPEHLLYDSDNLSIVGTVNDSKIIADKVLIGTIKISYSQLNSNENTEEKSIPVYLTVRLCNSDVNKKWSKKTVKGIDDKNYERWYLIK